MKDNAKVKNQEQRKREFEEKEMDKKRRKYEKEENKKRKAENIADQDPRVEGSAQIGGASSSRDLKRERDVEEDMDITRVANLVDEWVAEVKGCMIGEEIDVCETPYIDDDGVEEEILRAWDDVHGGDLPIKKVIEARKEEIGYMASRNIWSLKPIQDCWDPFG